MNKKNINKKNNNNKTIMVIVVSIIVLGFGVFTFINKEGYSNSDINIVGNTDLGTNNNTNGNSSLNNNISEPNKKETVILSETGKLVIPIEEISAKATFYPIDVNGTNLEILAVKAPDGSIRTAFNTCQICYSSGRGYYVQNGDKLVCQNCGNKFATSEVEVNRNGCNPVPITGSDKTVDEENITISKEFLDEYKVIFENWKNEF